MGYISLPVTTDSNALVQTALTNIGTKIPGWVPREGNLEVLLLEEFATMAADAATVASDAQESIFKYYGGLVGVTPNEGAKAQIMTRWNLVNPAPSGGVTYTAGTVAGFYYSGVAYQFVLVSDLTINQNDTSGTALMEAIAVGSMYNLYDVSGLNWNATTMLPAASDSTVAYIAITQTQSSLTQTLTIGVDAESDTAFLDRLTAELQLLAPRPITPSDYSLFSDNVSGVYRTLAIDGYNPYFNVFSAADANFGTLASTPSGWTAIGKGSTVPALSVSGTSPTASLQLTMANIAAPTITLSAVAAAGATTLSCTTTGMTAPMALMMTNGTNTEVAIVSAVTTGTLTLFSPLLYSYTTASPTVITIMQGVTKSNFVTDTYTNSSNLFANSNYYNAAALVKLGASDTTGIPVMVAAVTYADNSTLTFSSVVSVTTNLANDLGKDYTASPKLVSAIVSSTNSNTDLTPGNSGGDYSINQPIKSVQYFVVWYNATSSGTHKILYNSFNQVPFDFSASGLDSRIAPSNYNWVPDSTLASYANTNSNNPLWTLGTGFNALPTIGLQFTGNASGATASSPVFNLSNVTFDTSGNQTVGNSKYFTAMAKIDASILGTGYTGSGTNSITLQVYSASTAAVLASSVLPATNGNINWVYVNFSIPAGSAAHDIQLQIVTGAGVALPVNGSVIISQMGLYTTTSAGVSTPPNVYATGYSWTPGGKFTSGKIFNAPRNVAVVPTSSSGLAVNSSIMYTLLTYLRQSREANFTVNGMIPNYVPINVTYSAVAEPGYDASALTTNVQAAIKEFISPAVWNGGSHTPPSWDGIQTSIQAYDVANVINSVTGVASVTYIALTAGSLETVGITSASNTGTTATITTSSAHKLSSGQFVSVSGTSNSSFNLSNVSVTVTSATTFTYTTASGTYSATGGFVTLMPQSTIAMPGPAPLPLINNITGNVAMNPTDALVGIL